MSESKMLKAKCDKTGIWFGLELKQFGSIWKVVNMVRLSEEEARIVASEIKQSEFVTNDNLIPCRKCGGRKIGGCGCAKRSRQCSKSMKYQFDCVYCDNLHIDYSRPLERSPYAKWAGISNIPDAIKDRYGNPAGSQYDLAQDGSFEGYKVIVVNLAIADDIYNNFSKPAAALRKKGFEVVEYHRCVPSEDEFEAVLFNPKNQLWFISDRFLRLSRRHVEIVARFFNEGHGVYIWGDNDPYYADANRILSRIVGTSMQGNSRGNRVLGVQKSDGKPGIIPNHPITTGIVNFYEGTTVAQVNVNLSLKPLIFGSNKKVVAAYYDEQGKRALVDGGFTRLFYKWNTAGTNRYVVNAAAWLANIERFGYGQ